LRHELFTPLIASCSHDRPEILKQLLGVPGVDVDKRNLKGQTALMYAAACGNLELVLLLLGAGADRAATDDKKRTATDWANLKNMPLAGAVIRCDPARYTLVDCARIHDAAGVEALLAQGFAVNRRDAGETAIVAAARSASGAVIKTLASVSKLQASKLRSGEPSGEALDFESRDDSGETALTAACRLGHVDIVLLLLKLGAVRSPTASATAASKGHVLCGVVVNSDPALVHLHDACANGVLLQVEALLLQGVSVNAADPRPGRNGSSPLMAAAGRAGGGRRGKAVRIVVDRLLEEKAIEVNAKNSKGVTCLMIAAGNGAIGLCKKLIQEGADRDCEDGEKRGALWWAYNGVPVEEGRRSGEGGEGRERGGGGGGGGGRREEGGGSVDSNQNKAGLKNAGNYLAVSVFAGGRKGGEKKK